METSDHNDRERQWVKKHRRLRPMVWTLRAVLVVVSLLNALFQLWNTISKVLGR